MQRSTGSRTRWECDGVNKARVWIKLYTFGKLRLIDCWPEGGYVKGHSANWRTDWGSQEKDSVGWLERQATDWWRPACDFIRGSWQLSKTTRLQRSSFDQNAG